MTIEIYSKIEYHANITNVILVNIDQLFDIEVKVLE